MVRIRFYSVIMLLLFAAIRAETRPVAMRSISGSTIRLSKQCDLSFGGIVGGLSAGTIIVHPNGSVNYSGGVMRNMRAIIPEAHPASLTFTLWNSVHCREVDHCITDDDESSRIESDDLRANDDHLDFLRHGTNVSLLLPSSAMLQLSSNPSIEMAADNFALLRTNGTVVIGATLHVGARQPAGTYSGTYVITLVCE